MTLRYVLAALLALSVPAALAQSPAGEQIPYQGRLTDAAGAPLADGQQTIQFTLSDAASGSWTETAIVQTVGGVFTHYLGSVAAIAGVDFADDPTLSLTLDPGGAATAFGPVPLGAVPAAYRALDGGSPAFPLSGTASTGFNGATLRLRNTGDGDALYIGDAGRDGVAIVSVDGNGVFVQDVSTGVLVFQADGTGVAVGSAGGDGVRVESAGGDGVEVAFADRTGVFVARADLYGVDGRGALGNYLRRSVDNAALDPDLVLGAVGGTSDFQDDGVLSSDPAFAGSDLILRSNDGAVVWLDSNNDQFSSFFVVNSAYQAAFVVREDGTTSISGQTLTGEAAVYLDDPTAPDARTLTLPAAVSAERLVAFSGNATTDASGAATVRLPDYAQALAGDFRYQLTAIGSFAQAIVSEKVAGGQFVIRTSEPDVEVSWRVEGVRQDAWAVANAHEAVEVKAEAGLYVHPEAFGQSPETALARVADAPPALTDLGRARLADEAEQLRRQEADRADDARQRDAEQRDR